MRIMFTVILAGSTVLSTAAFAESWAGKLVDASCYEQHKKIEACDATSKTSSFALEAGGTMLRLDQNGNAKAAAALKNRADRSDPGKAQSSHVMAKVDGTQQNGVITVENIEVQ